MILNILLIMVGHIQHSKISEKLSQGGLYYRWLPFGIWRPKMVRHTLKNLQQML